LRANERPPTDDASTLLSRAAYEQAKTTESYRRFVRATVSYYAAAIAMGEVLQRVSADVKDFVLDGDGAAANGVPPESLVRACALMEQPEVTKAVASIASAVAHGAAVGASAGARGHGDGGEASASGRGGAGDNLMESIVDVLLEPKRLRAVSDFVGETSKSLMSAFASVAKDNAEVLRVITGVGGEREDAGREKPSAAQRVVTFLEEPKNRNLLVDVGREFVDSAVSTYVREMGEDNMYADMFEVVRQPRNQQIFLDIMQAMVETSVRSYVLASTEVALHPESVTHHHVLRHEDKNSDSPTSPLVSRFTSVETSTPPASSGPHAHGEEDIHSPALIGSWKELFTAATENKENRRLVMATTGTATRAAISGLSSGAYEIVFNGRFAGHKLKIHYWALSLFAAIFAMISVSLYIFMRLFVLIALARSPT